MRMQALTVTRDGRVLTPDNFTVLDHGEIMLNEDGGRLSFTEEDVQHCGDQLVLTVVNGRIVKPSKEAPSVGPINFTAASRYADVMADISNVGAAYRELMDILIAVTHHDGALQEYRARWEPIVTAELRRRSPRIPTQLLSEQDAAEMRNYHQYRCPAVGTKLTVALRVVDPEQAELLHYSMYDKTAETLVAGCQVEAIEQRTIDDLYMLGANNVQKLVLGALAKESAALKAALKDSGLLPS